MSTVQIQIPKAFKGLFEPKRYKVYYGGRGGAKSHNFARALLVKGMKKKMRYLCCRELQGSIGDSVHKLLSDIIDAHGLNAFYEVLKNSIRGKNGTEFFFKGLKHNATEIKSTEGIDVVWVEEAELVSANSWEILIPTIRKGGSEIWVSFNPKNPTDPTYIRMVANADDDMLVKKVSWRDNPFFPDVLEKERKKLKKDDPEAYEHIWEGGFDTRHNGAVYAKTIDEAREDKRISKVPYDPSSPVITAWDLGYGDSTAIWFAQVVGREPRIIDCYSNSQQGINHYIDYVRGKPYSYEGHFLPHDARQGQLRTGMSLSDQLKQMGFNHTVLGLSDVAAGIELGRKLLKTVWIDKEKCKDGLHALMNYQYEYDERRQMFKPKPLHDWSSDYADAFRYLALALEQDKKIINTNQGATNTAYNHSNAWLG